MKVARLLFLAAAILLSASVSVYAQNPSGAGTATAVQLTTGFYSTTAISSTAAVNTQTTLTIAAPAAGLYNYICYLAFDASQNGTATAATNAVTTSTNFNSFALKFSLAATANATYDWSAHWGTPGAGCVKSASPGTSTTFVSPAAATNTAFTWYATYYQAP